MRIRRSSGDQWLALINIMVTKIKRSAEDKLSCSCCFSDKKIKWSVFMVTCNREPENYTGKSKEALKRFVNHFGLGIGAFNLTSVNIIILKTLWGHPWAVSSLFTEYWFISVTVPINSITCQVTLHALQSWMISAARSEFYNLSLS